MLQTTTHYYRQLPSPLSEVIGISHVQRGTICHPEHSEGSYTAPTFPERHLDKKRKICYSKL